MYFSTLHLLKGKEFIFHAYSTLNQQTGSVEHLSLVTVGPARVRPSVIPGNAEDGKTAVVYLQLRAEQTETHSASDTKY